MHFTHTHPFQGDVDAEILMETQGVKVRDAGEAANLTRFSFLLGRTSPKKNLPRKIELTREESS